MEFSLLKLKNDMHYQGHCWRSILHGWTQCSDGIFYARNQGYPISADRSLYFSNGEVRLTNEDHQGV
jgi:hypothetical protein